MTEKPTATPVSTPEPEPAAEPAPPSDTAAPRPPKKKLSLDISDVTEVLERKISP